MVARLRLPLVAALLWSLACGGDWRAVVPTPGGYDAQLQALVGGSVNTAVAALGAPSRTVDLAEGHRLYVWEKMSDAHTAVTGTKTWDPERQQEVIVLAGGERIPFDCVTEIEADGAGKVVRTASRGVACLGLMPSPTAAPGTTSTPAATPAAATPAPVPAAVAPAAVAPAPAAAAPTEATTTDAAPTAAQRAGAPTDAAAAQEGTRRRPRPARDARDARGR